MRRLFDMSLDRRIHGWCTRLRGRQARLNRAATVGAHQLIFLLAATVLGCDVFLAPDSWLALVSQEASAAAIAWAVCMVIELIVGRPRPYQAFHDQTLGSYWTPNPSFPSAHTTLAFAMALFMQLQFGALVGIPFFAAAALIGLSRVYVGVHYFSDVVAGAILGSAVSWTLIFFLFYT